MEKEDVKIANINGVLKEFIFLQRKQKNNKMSIHDLLVLQELTGIVKVRQELVDIKNAELEVANYYEFLYLMSYFMKPKVVVELGTHHGVSMLYLIEGYADADFYTVDKNPEAGALLKNTKAKIFIGDSADIASKLPNEIDFLFEDTDHKYNTLSREFKAYLPKMRRGGVILFDDMKSCPEAKQWWNDLRYPTKVTLDRLHIGGGMTAIIKE